jgi:uncharacterized protein YeaO (DUF488 family)
VKKEALVVDDWIKGVAPSTLLREWFDHRVERWKEFCTRYRQELDANPAAWVPILEAERRGPVTLLYSARDVLHNSAVVLRDYLSARRARASRLHRRPYRAKEIPIERDDSVRER